MGVLGLGARDREEAASIDAQHCGQSFGVLGRITWGLGVLGALRLNEISFLSQFGWESCRSSSSIRKRQSNRRVL